MQNIIKQMSERQEVFWLNSNLDNKLSPDITAADVANAAARLSRFAPYIKKAFPETEASGGIIESPLAEILAMKKYLADEFNSSKNRLTKGIDSAPYGRLLLKCDNLLPVSGSIKARGGIYEVLCLAEKLALKSGMLTQNGDYSLLDGENFRELFSKYSIAVGSTGNLGLSIGIMGARLGFKVKVHMSSDARQWKKDLLRKKGAEVIEYAGDYQQAVFEGRRLALSDPFCHFIDDENSKTLFLGYATAAERLRCQLESLKITVDKNHPLFVYLPCGVGGGPGGVAYGLKQLYGADAHCFFAEPVEAPCMLLGVMTGKHDDICVQDIGLSGKTIADGLAVGRPSKFVGKIAGNLIDGYFTVLDERIQRLARELYKLENIFIEPSAAAGIPGYCLLPQIIAQNAGYAAKFDAGALKNSTHIIWATGGGMVPKDDRDKLLNSL